MMLHLTLIYYFYCIFFTKICKYVLRFTTLTGHKDMSLKLLHYIYIRIFELKSVDYMIKSLAKTHSKNNFRIEDIMTSFANYL